MIVPAFPSIRVPGTLHPDQYLVLSDFTFLPVWYLILVSDSIVHITNLVKCFYLFLLADISNSVESLFVPFVHSLIGWFLFIKF